MPFAQVRDIRMYYELRGEGPRLFYFNGSGGDLRRKPNVFDGRLGRAFTILAQDHRGLGQTEKPDRPYTMAEYAEDAAALMGVVGWDRAHVMGVSFGGMVAQEFAIRFPERVDRLVLACTSPGGAGGSQYPLHELLQYDPAERDRRGAMQSDLRITEEWIAAHPEEWEAQMRQRMEAAQVGAKDPDHAMGSRRQLEARATHDVWDRLPSLQMPVFICGGKYDGIAPVANQGNLLRRIPNAHLELFEGGHGFLGQDRSVWPRIIGFLGGELDAEFAERAAARP